MGLLALVQHDTRGHFTLLVGTYVELRKEVFHFKDYFPGIHKNIYRINKAQGI